MKIGYDNIKEIFIKLSLVFIYATSIGHLVGIKFSKQ